MAIKKGLGELILEDARRPVSERGTDSRPQKMAAVREKDKHAVYDGQSVARARYSPPRKKG